MKKLIDQYSKKMDRQEKTIEKISSLELISDKLFTTQSLIVVVSRPGSGKTVLTIKRWVPEWIKTGKNVIYFDMDSRPSDQQERIKFFRKLNKKGPGKGAFIAPETNNKRVEEYIDNILSNSESYSLNDYIFVFDTLKKAADIQNKNTAADFFKEMRSLTARGATIIFLAHSTKYYDKDGSLIPDGVGDVKNDVDILYLMYSLPDKENPNFQTVSLCKEKARHDWINLSYKVGFKKEYGKIKVLQKFIDIKKAMLIQDRIPQYDTVIKIAIAAIASGEYKTKTLLENHIKSKTNLSDKKIKDSLDWASDEENKERVFKVDKEGKFSRFSLLKESFKKTGFKVKK